MSNGAEVAAEMMSLADELGLPFTEASWFFAVPDQTLYSWRRKGTETARPQSLTVLVHLSRRAVRSGRYRPDRLYHFLGLRQSPIRGVHRAPGKDRNEESRARGWAYLIRCAYTAADLQQETMFDHGRRRHGRERHQEDDDNRADHQHH